MHFLISLLACACHFMTIYASLPPITVKGSKFFADGKQFYLKGVAYQGTPEDPLIDAKQCAHDADLMKTIGTNSIRVYHVDPSVDHTACMNIFEDAGIYIWVDLSTFSNAILQDGPKWTAEQFYGYTNVMDAFQHFNNLAGFWIGNEIITSNAGSPAAPFIKAAVVDMKAYHRAKNYRDIAIGYSAADIAELRPHLQDYLACGSDPNLAIDFFGLNAYEWCGPGTTYETSGYPHLQEITAKYNLPIFFSETGCNVGGERTFADQSAIFGPQMRDTWSGSIVYEWVQEVNDYGLVSYPGGGIYTGAPIPIQPDFDNLKKQWSGVNTVGVAEAAYTPSLSAPACPLATGGGWQVNGDVPLPTLGAAVVAQMAQSSKAKPTSATVLTTSTSAPAPPPPAPSSSSSVVPPVQAAAVVASSSSTTTSSVSVPPANLPNPALYTAVPFQGISSTTSGTTRIPSGTSGAQTSTTLSSSTTTMTKPLKNTANSTSATSTSTSTTRTGSGSSNPKDVTGESSAEQVMASGVVVMAAFVMAYLLA